MNTKAALFRRDWSYIEKNALDDFTSADWDTLGRQRRSFYAERQATHVLSVFSLERDDPTFGYCVNNYEHGLQTATMVLRSGHDEETVVAALLHDIGFISCPTTHGQYAASLLAPYVTEQTQWVLAHHQIFQQIHLRGYPGVDPNERERWRGHPYFECTANFVEKFDQRAIDPNRETLPIDAFVPFVQRVFARSPHNVTFS